MAFLTTTDLYILYIIIYKDITVAIFYIIIWPCLKRTEKDQIQELDWLKWILTAV